MRLLIIRHGDPDYEHDTVTEKGAREVELLSERLVKEGITKIYCSPLGRARATAAPTCRKLGLEPTIFDWLQEFPAPAVIPPGEERLRCIWNLPPAYWSSFPEHFDREAWRQSPLLRDTDVAERYDRICTAFDAVIAEHGFVRDGMCYHIKSGCENSTETIAFFCHLGLGNCLLAHITGMPLPQWWHTVFLPTSSVSTVYMEKHLPNQPIAIGRVVGIGDVSHLYAGGEPVSSSGLFSKMP